MANRTVKDAKSIKGQNPQHLIEKIIRSRVYDCRYWKEECFALTAELLVDKAIELRAIGGVFGGNIQPTNFICLVLKMLQIQPEKDIIIEFIKNEEFKYVRALGAYYMRLTGTSQDIYKYMEPLLNDYRKLRMMNREGQYVVITMDEFIDNLLREERYLDVILPRIQKRHVLEESNELDPRVCVLDEDLEASDSSEEEEKPKKPAREAERRRSRSRSPRPKKDRELDRRRRDKERDRERDNRDKRRRSPERSKRRSRSTSPSGRHRSQREIDHRRKSEKSKRDKERDRDRDREKDRDRRHKDSRRDKDSTNVDQEVAEANALRAKLGLPPLK
ncbi:pre-mRNA-splicing factor 38A [Cloeon dipterum]|uniref:pre-mRNA-splicing factor 38A n=1 Tax=Cloeon dipterum TaxID=197152 RepID=UPI00321FEED0